MYSYAQNFEDVYILRAFKDLKDGFYIDIGAYDPDEESVTKALYDLGWHGVNIEPGPSFDRFVKARPRDINLQCAIGLTPGRVSFYYHPTDPGTSTLTPNLHAKLVGRIDARQEFEVEARTLTSLLEEFGADRTIHVLKIDIEGLEAPVISSVDWSKHRPILIITEATRPYTNERIDEGWTPLLQMSGYRLVFFDGINTYYLREENAELSSAFMAPINVLDGFRKWHPETAAAAPMLDNLVNEATILNPTKDPPTQQSDPSQGYTQNTSELDALKKQVAFWKETSDRLTARVDQLIETEKWAAGVQQDLERADAFGKSALAELDSAKASLQALREEREALQQENSALASAKEQVERELIGQVTEARLEGADFEGALLEIIQRVQKSIGADSEISASPGLGHNDRRQPAELRDAANAVITAALEDLEGLRVSALELENSKRIIAEMAMTISDMEGQLERAHHEHSLIGDAIQEEANRQIESLTDQLDSARSEHDKVLRESQSREDTLALELQQRIELVDHLRMQQVDLFQNLKMREGPMAIRLALPLARVIRFLSRLFRLT